MFNLDDLTVSAKEKQEFFDQLDGFYAKSFSGGMELAPELLAIVGNYSDPYEKRAASYDFLANRLEIEVFGKCPYALHYNNRLSRWDVEASGISYWYSNLLPGQEVLAEFNKNTQGNYENGLAIYYLPVDNGHLTIDYQTVLEKGIEGIKNEVIRYKQKATPEKQSFYFAMERGLNAYALLAERFSKKAETAAVSAQGADKERMLELAEALKNVPLKPAKTFTEAIVAITFLYYAVPALDGGNVSVLGHVDRLLGKYLDADLLNKSITLEKAFDYIWRFLYIPDSRFGKNHMGTNCTVTLGGCDQNGHAVYNKVTHLIIKAYMQLRCMDPKLNIRIAKNSPKELIDLAAEAISQGNNNVCIFNDEVILSANQKAGKALEDARLYVAGGCQENILASCEQNSRATIYMNCLPALFNLWQDNTWSYFTDSFCPQKTQSFSEGDDFERIYQKTLHNLKVHITAQVNMKNISEAKGLYWCASPAHSALIKSCVEKGTDMFLGGTKYSSGSVSLAGTATLIDSLLAIKWVVFDQKLMPFDSFISIVKNNFANNQALRKRIIQDAPKFTRDEQANLFAARFLRDAAHMQDGLKNTRGGKYEPSLFSFRSFTALGAKFPATPDGRLKGEYLSASASPSLLAKTPATTVIGALKHIDLTDYPVVAVTDLKLPRISPAVARSLIINFINNGGSVLQCNTVDQHILLDAKAHPERHSDLVVRISGYSARFVALSEQEQDEVIARNVN